MYQSVIKRVLDIFVAAVAIIILFLPMLLVVAWVKLDSRGPALFRQLRSGKDKKPFTVYKFRTMSVDAPSDSPTNSFKNSGAFITKSGKIMRKLSIDELPQLLNVIIGDMSIVGPRPVVLKETNLLKLRDQYGANAFKPGISGWAQVNGRDELHDELKAEMDGIYVENFGFLMDIKCVVHTFSAVLSIKGHREGHEVEGVVNQVIDRMYEQDQKVTEVA